MQKNCQRNLSLALFLPMGLAFILLLPTKDLEAKCMKCEATREKIHYFLNWHKSDLTQVPGAINDNNWMNKPWKSHWWDRMPKKPSETAHMGMHHNSQKFRRQNIDCMVCTGDPCDYDLADLESFNFTTIAATDDDEHIAYEVRDRIVLDEGLSWNAKTVNVRTENGHVTMCGAVNDIWSKEQLSRIALECVNVTSIDNQVNVIPSKHSQTLRQFNQLTKEPFIACEDDYKIPATIVYNDVDFIDGDLVEFLENYDNDVTENNCHCASALLASNAGGVYYNGEYYFFEDGHASDDLYFEDELIYDDE